MKNGILRERQVRRLLESEGWWVGRAAGSLGDADLVALKDGETPRLLEIKAGEGNCWKHFSPEERMQLRLAARRAGAIAELVHWPSRQEPRFIPESDWPG